MKAQLSTSLLKLHLLSVICFLSFNAIAQKDSLDSIVKKFPPDFNNSIPDQSIRKDGDSSHEDDLKLKNGLMMKGGKMLIIKNGTTTEMNEEMYMSNGTKAMTNGIIVRKNGSKVMMHEGDCMDVSGKITPCKKHRIK